MAEYVYFVQAPDSGLIKIGWTTNLVKRFKALQSHYAARLDLRIHGAGTKTDERALHNLFRHARDHGDWFHPVPELLAVIEYLRASLPPGQLEDYEAYKNALH